MDSYVVYHLSIVPIRINNKAEGLHDWVKKIYSGSSSSSLSNVSVVRPIEESFSSTEKDHYHTFMSNALSF